MKILVLGGTGAMGVPLVRKLQHAGYEVYVTTRSERKTEDGVCYITGDAHEEDFVKRLFVQNRYDVIVDFMVYGSIELEKRLPLLLDSTNHYFFVYEINQLLNTYKDAGGIWHEDRFRPLATAMVNLSMNMVMVQFWGIYGVILSTVLSMLFVGMPWLFHNLFQTLFERKQLVGYLKSLAFYVAISVAACGATTFTCSFIWLGDWATLFVRAMVCCVMPNVVFCAVYHKMPEFKRALHLIDKMTKGRFRIVHKMGG